MSKLNVDTVSPNEGRTLPIFAEFDEISDRIRQRAFQLFSDRGFQSGRELDDWLQAERLICWPQSELVEHEENFRIDVALAGFKADEIAVTAAPGEVIVKAEHEEKKTDDTARIHFSEFRGSTAFRRFTLPAEISVDQVSAKFQNGMLEIRAPKTGAVKAETTKKRRAAAKKKTTAKSPAKKKTAKNVAVRAKK